MNVAGKKVGTDMLSRRGRIRSVAHLCGIYSMRNRSFGLISNNLANIFILSRAKHIPH